MSDDNHGKLVRTVSYYRAVEDAERWENPLTNNRFMLTVLAGNGGNRLWAEAMVMDRMEEVLDHLEEERNRGQKPHRDELRSLWATYQYAMARIGSMATMQRTELSLLSEGVSPTKGQAEAVPWKRWATLRNLQDLFDVAHGTEVNLVTGRGRGKSNLEALCSEIWVGAGPRYHVIHNIDGAKPQDHPERWHSCRKLSDVFRAYVRIKREDPDACILFAFDEPGQTLRAGTGKTKAQEQWDGLRPWLRKMGMPVLYGWQQEAQVFKSLREDPDVVQLSKASKFHVKISQPTEGGGFRIVDIIDVPKAATPYNDKGMTLLEVDVNMLVITRALSMAETFAERLDALEAALDNPRTYLKEYQDENSPDHEEIFVAARTAALQDASSLLSKKRTVFLRDALFQRFRGDGLTHAASGALKAELDDVLQRARDMIAAGSDVQDLVDELDVGEDLATIIEAAEVALAG